MALEMDPECERCETAIAGSDESHIWPYECCPTCTASMDAVCPNCAGELVRHPRPAG